MKFWYLIILLRWYALPVVLPDQRSSCRRRVHQLDVRHNPIPAPQTQPAAEIVHLKQAAPAPVHAAEKARSGFKTPKYQGIGMQSIVLVTPEPDHFLELAKELEATQQVQVSFVKTKAEAIKIASTASPALIILDAQPEEETVFEMARSLIMVNAAIPIAVVSPMPEKEFESASEGLGILAQLKPNPGRSEAQMLISKLKMLKTLF